MWPQKTYGLSIILGKLFKVSITKGRIGTNLVFPDLDLFTRINPCLKSISSYARLSCSVILTLYLEPQSIEGDALQAPVLCQNLVCVETLDLVIESAHTSSP